jgi:hypothetical protein
MDDGNLSVSASDRVRRYVAMRIEKPIGKLDDEIHGVHVGTEWEAELRLSDLRGLLAELDEADRRAGAAERQNEYLQDSQSRRTQWLDKAKNDAGYHRNVSFDDVWREALTALKARRDSDALRDIAQ